MLVRAKQPVPKSINYLERVSVNSDLTALIIQEIFLPLSSEFQKTSASSILFSNNSFLYSFGSLAISLPSQKLFIENSGNEARDSQRLIIILDSTEEYKTPFCTSSDPIYSFQTHKEKSTFVTSSSSVFFLFELINKSTDLISTNLFYYAQYFQDLNSLLIINGKDFTANPSLFNLTTKQFSQADLESLPLFLTLSIYNNFSYNFNYQPNNSTNSPTFRPFAKYRSFTILSPL